MLRFPKALLVTDKNHVKKHSDNIFFKKSFYFDIFSKFQNRRGKKRGMGEEGVKCGILKLYGEEFLIGNTSLNLTYL